MQRCHFRNTKLVDCDVTGMSIDGVPVTDMIKAYQEINSISNELPALEGEKLTKAELSGKRFAFLYIEDKRGEEQNGVLRLDSDGTIAEYENPNEAEWEVDEAGRLLVRSKEGRVSTVFNKVSIIDDK